MRVSILVGWVSVGLLLLSGCQISPRPPTQPPTPGPVSPLTPTIVATAVPFATLPAEPTPTEMTLTIWGPPSFAPTGEETGGEVLSAQMAAFEAAHPDIRLRYEAKPPDGPASLLNYLRSASAVAPSALPDLIILPSSELDAAAQTQLLMPLDGLLTEESEADLFPFAQRDTRVEGTWVALPLGVQVEQGVVSTAARATPPTRLAEWLAESAPIWLFAGQARQEGEMSNALLLQLLALPSDPPEPNRLPPRESLVTLLTTFQAAQQRGSIPRQVLALDESATLYERLRTEQADLIQSSSREFLLERARTPGLRFAALPTLSGRPVTVVEGYLIALTTHDARQQAAAARYLEWWLEPERLAEWSRATHWLPARRSALVAALDDATYRSFLSERLENGWLRPSGASWSGFAQAMQEQFRAVMQEQATPTEAVEALYQSYGETSR